MAKSAWRNAPIEHAPVSAKAAGDERRAGGDERLGAAAGGGLLGPGGEALRAILPGWLLGLAIVALVMVFNVLTRGHDAPSELPRALIDEGASALVTAPLLLLPGGVALWIRRRSPAWWGVALACVAGATLYSVAHVAGFVAVRELAYRWVLGSDYRFGPLPWEFFYEAAKDGPAFGFAVALFWLFLRWRPGPAAAVSPATPQVFDIRDGQRLVRAEIGEILAVRSAGNYAEFLLADGRRPLMRSPLARLEARLAPLGFVRTHRSWLVNAGRVTGLRPAGSGDYAVELGPVQAPLSRRFPAALKTLRA